MNIYVGNLSYETTADELQQMFAEYGAVELVNLITDGDFIEGKKIGQWKARFCRRFGNFYGSDSRGKFGFSTELEIMLLNTHCRRAHMCYAETDDFTRLV